jgi:hypothetical protein
MEKSNNYRVLVEQVNRYSHEFSVSASSEVEAKRIVEKKIEEDPVEGMKNTYDGTDV